MSEEKAGYRERVTNLVMVARTVQTLTSGDDVETIVTEQWGLPCKVTAKEDAKGIEHYEVEYRGGGPEESGNGAIVEGARLRALRDGRVSVSRETAETALAALYSIEVGVIAANLKVPKEEAQARATDAVQAFATALSFGTRAAP